MNKIGFRVNIDITIQEFSEVLRSLIYAESIMYKDWSPSNHSEILKDKVGIYHFYEERSEGINSLYIGKAGLGNSGDWDLYERLKQHFQPSQKYTYLGKFAKSKSLTTEKAKGILMNSEVKLQWVTVEKTSELNENLMRLECFCKAILSPIYTDE